MKSKKFFPVALAAMMLASISLGACASEKSKSATDSDTIAAVDSATSIADSTLSEDIGESARTADLNFDTFIVNDNSDGSVNVYIRSEKEIASNLMKKGFRLVSSDPDTMYTSDETPVKAKSDVYEKNGTKVTINYTIEDHAKMVGIDLFCEDSDVLELLRNSFEDNGFDYEPGGGSVFIMTKPDNSLVVFESKMNDGTIMTVS